MKSLMLVALLFAGQVQAAADSELVKRTLEAQTTCGRVVRFDERNLYQGFGRQRDVPGKVRVTELGATESIELVTTGAVMGIVNDGDVMYVLTPTLIEEWDLPTRERKGEYPTYALSGAFDRGETAQSFARHGDMLIIAHGRLGVSFFDLKTKRLTNQFRLIPQQLPLQSQAMGVTVQGDHAYVVMDNYHLVRPGEGPQAFRGIVVIHMPTQKVLSELDGMDPGVDQAISDGENLIVSFRGMPIWKYTLASLRGNKLPEPALRLWKFPMKGHPTGSPAMDAKYYYTCYMTPPPRGENGGFYKNIPMVLDRRVMMLD